MSYHLEELRRLAKLLVEPVEYVKTGTLSVESSAHAVRMAELVQTELLVRELPWRDVVPSKPPLEVMSCPVLSTGNLSAEEAARSPSEWPTHCHESEMGFVVYFGTLADLQNAIDSGDDGDGAAAALARWPGLLAAARWAETFGFQWLRFDRDAEPQPGLPTFEW